MRAALLIVSLASVAVATFGVALVYELPSTDSALSHAQGVILPSDEYVWRCPVFATTSDTVTGCDEVTTVIHVDRADFESSMLSTSVRSGTVFYASPVNLVDPSDRHVLLVRDVVEAEIAALEGSTGHVYTDYQRLMCALSFVRSLGYVGDADLYGADEFYAKPLEVLYAHGGDCEDVSVLFCSLAVSMGYDAVLLDYPGHVAAGVVLDGDHAGVTYSDGSATYHLCECTSLTGSFAPVRLDSSSPVGGSDAPVVRHIAASVAGDVVEAYRNLIQRTLSI